MYRGLFEESRDAIFVSSPGGRILDVNPAGLELFGYSRAEIVELDVARDLYRDPSDRKRLRRRLEAEGYLKDYEVRLKTKTGRELIALETSTVLRKGTGRIVAYRGILRDVTEERKLQERLHQTQKLEALGLLVGTVSHDFNNLLVAISGFVELSLDKIGPDDPLRPDLEEVRKTTAKAARLTHQLRTFSRRRSARPRLLDLNEVITDSLPLLSRICGSRIQLTTRLGDGLGRIRADRGQMEQVLVNLTINARDAMPEGGSLDVTTNRVEDGRGSKASTLVAGDAIELAVKDTGHGMDTATRDRIFEPFFTTREDAGGTGLGLSTVQAIVRQAGGSIRVESDPGRGTRFQILLPRGAKTVRGWRDPATSRAGPLGVSRDDLRVPEAMIASPSELRRSSPARAKRREQRPGTAPPARGSRPPIPGRSRARPS